MKTGYWKRIGNSMDIKEKKFKDIGRYALCFAMLFALSWLFPYTGDDWAWGSQIGLDRLHTWFDNYSGRYVGNLIVLALTRSNMLKSLAMTAAITGIIFLLERLIKERWSFYISIVLLICLPKAVLRQAVVWTAGFSNYVTSIFFTLIYIVYIYWIFDEEPNQNKLRQRILPCIPLVALGMINTLIVENVTLYNVVLGIAVIIYVLFRYHKVLIQHVCYFAGTICGTAYMFSNSVYHSISSNADGYRSVAKGGIISQALKNYFDVIYKEYFMNNIVLNLFILCICYVIYVNYKKQSVESKNKLGKVLAACLGIMTCYDAWSLFSYIGLGTVTKQTLLIVIEGSATVAAGISLIIFALIMAIHYTNFWRILFVACSVLCMAAPLFAVNPIGSRCFFPSYVLFVLFAEELCRIVADNFIIVINEKILKRVAVTIAGVGMVFYLCIFASVYRADHQRISYIRDKVSAGEKKIEILHLPYESYIWTPTPNKGEIWEEIYKLFYDIPQNVTLNSVWVYSK